MFNEEKIVRQSIETIFSYLKELPLNSAVLAVDDGSKDRTKEIIQELIHSGNGILYIISHLKNEGYGAAIRTGIRFAGENNYDYVLFMDSDLTNHPKYLKYFYQKIQEGYDYIKATRYGKGAGVKGVPFNRRIISKVGNWIARLLCGIPLHDLTNGFRAAKTRILKQIELKETGFAVIMEELSQIKPIAGSYAEIPYVLTSRKSWQGKTHFRYDIKTYCKYFNYAFKNAFIKRPKAD